MNPERAQEAIDESLREAEQQEFAACDNHLVDKALSEGQSTENDSPEGQPVHKS